jgi:hypothetical protein
MIMKLTKQPYAPGWEREERKEKKRYQFCGCVDVTAA